MAGFMNSESPGNSSSTGKCCSCCQGKSIIIEETDINGNKYIRQGYERKAQIEDVLAALKDKDEYTKKLEKFKEEAESLWAYAGYEKQHQLVESYTNIFGVKPKVDGQD